MRRVTEAVAAGIAAAVLYTFASPPHDWSLLAWLVPGLLLFGMRDATAAIALVRGAVFGIGIGFGITGWASHAVLQYFEFNVVAATAVALLAWTVYSAAPYALLVVAHTTIARRLPPLAEPAVGAWLWVVVEILRSTPVIGIPWGLLSHTQWRLPAMLQIAELGGAYAVSFVIAFVSLSVACLLRDRMTSRPGARHALARLGPAALLVGATVYYGANRLRSDALAPEDGSRRVAIIQASLENGFRWQRAFFERSLATYARLTARGLGEARTDLVVWPENAVNFYVEREPLLRAQIGAVARRASADLLVGSPRLESAGVAHNSALVIDPRGRIQASYDKRILVPFAEYDPIAVAWRRLTGEAGKKTSEPVYLSGEGASVLPTSAFNVGTLICYEILYPHLVREAVRRGADLLVNLSNDAWLEAGDGAASAQHFAMATLRAVEMRRYLVRASSSGISGFVRPTGEPYDMLPVGRQGVALGEVAPRDGITPYARWGETWVLVGGLAVLGAFGRAARGARA